MPAIDIGRSVSRVGGAAQTKAMRKVAGDVRLELSQYEEVVRFAKFGTEVDAATTRQIERGKRLQLALAQGAHEPMSVVDQIIVLFSAVKGYLDGIEFSEVEQFQQYLLTSMHAEHFPLLLRITREGDITDSIEEELHELVGAYSMKWLEREK